VAAVEHHDERIATLGERVASLLRNFLERSAMAGGDPALGPEGLGILLSRTYAEAAGGRPDESAEPDERRYVSTITGAIETLAEGGNVVLLGRGSPVVLHVLTMAPSDLRVQRIARREEIPIEEARRRVHESDRGRCAFHRKFFKVDPDDPSLFDLVIHTRRLSFEAGADLVVAAAQALTPSA
jgi:hypothetical protein